MAILERLKELLSPAAAPAEEDERDRVATATCVLLLEMAGADEDFSAEEREHIMATLRKRFSLSEEDATQLIEASKAARGQSYDLWTFTNQINKACPPDEKTRIIEEIWRVVYADGTLDAHEDHLVHKFARLLNLTHPQLIDAKLKVLDERNR
ncbi:MAG TPA: TerB family tellurite resistance protein [Candidatus Hydrogenedentes bacterium]|nr:TerB family tellurite resistance protein [Candidatus Hydrogenedentota bacterium]HIJ74432.1 TerB family tellurite resistance protein [Candidatus Hydrogenedentota bacterium]